MANGGIVTRRQTLTGIKTSATTTSSPTSKRLSAIHKRPIAAPEVADEPIYDNIEPVAIPKKQETPKPKNAQRRSKRIEGRRFLTIGYDGEVRTPLKETKNILGPAKVQRSKSAQTPTNKNKVIKKSASDDKENEIVFCNKVQRSLSLRSPRPQIVVPDSLRETIYDVTTPKSEKVR